ncbi:MAG: hypothetical protein RMJ98_19315 [Myxococcales bacterium]|nr:hypothetical protein [Polyangiaceae bacterium]MDW8251450.1 hypothetical protein [Myxococcales bacterium]
MPRPELSLRAAALRDKLLARLDPQTPRTIDDLLPWWERHGVLRVELARLLRQLVDEGQVEKGPEGYVLVVQGQTSSVHPVEAVPPPLPPADPTPPPAPPESSVPEPASIPPSLAPSETVHKEEPAPTSAPLLAGPETKTLVAQVMEELHRKPQSCASLLHVFKDANPNTIRGTLARLKSSGRITLDKQGIYRPGSKEKGARASVTGPASLHRRQG